MVDRFGVAITGGGLTVLVVGTFLPWLRSGSGLHDSYQSVDVLRELIMSGDAPVISALGYWQAIIPAITVSVALYALRLRRTAACAICVISIGVGAAAGYLALQGHNTDLFIGLAPIGPTVTFVGAVLALVGAVALLISLREPAPARG
ncbi:MAG TPA: hypothetical protein VHW44_08160 [Pseudonocardiaceae bacterium]|jgi:hypothetical protein|nr:hypothetical protein [Pseudonocardiaceae bacterium]